ncbi:sugar transferase [Thalassospira sp. SN3W]|uniref:sugar transferase n=1 Tax=Thalassospira sp. SN3W TaxID=3035476 RepID=UPI00311AE087
MILKRIFDVIISILALLVLAPILAFIFFQVRRKIGHPALFQQIRPGLHGKPFKMIKFRTMSEERDAKGQLLPDSDRLTDFGKALRATSVDELPELWNVLRGDMSLVGPRPLLMEYLPLYNEAQKRRHELRPGLTGWAQVNGRNALSWGEKFALDVWYVDNRSFWLDVKILLLTVKKVFTQSDINAEGTVSMSRFTGNDQCRD